MVRWLILMVNQHFELLDGAPFINLDISQLEKKDLLDHWLNKYYFLGFGKNMLRKIVKIEQKLNKKKSFG